VYRSSAQQVNKPQLLTALLAGKQVTGTSVELVIILTAVHTDCKHGSEVAYCKWKRPV